MTPKKIQSKFCKVYCGHTLTLTYYFVSGTSELSVNNDVKHKIINLVSRVWLYSTLFIYTVFYKTILVMYTQIK